MKALQPALKDLMHQGLSTQGLQMGATAKSLCLVPMPFM